MENKSYDKISFAIFLIFLGIAIIFSNLGLAHWGNLWRFFIDFWPLFIIIAGIKVVLSVFKFGNIIEVVFDVIVNFGLLAVLLMPQGLLSRSFVSTDEIADFEREVVLDDKFESREFNFGLNAGDFSITDTKDVQYHLRTTGRYNPDISKLSQSSRTDRSGTTKISSELELFPNRTFRFFNSRSHNKFDFLIGNFSSEEVVADDINIDLNAGKLDLELTETTIEKMSMAVNAADAKLLFTEKSLPEKIQVSVNAGNIDIYLPKELYVDLKYVVNAGSVQLHHREGVRDYSGLNIEGQSCFNYDGLKGKCSETVRKVNIDLSVSAGSANIFWN